MQGYICYTWIGTLFFRLTFLFEEQWRRRNFEALNYLGQKSFYSSLGGHLLLLPWHLNRPAFLLLIYIIYL